MFYSSTVWTWSAQPDSNRHVRGVCCHRLADGYLARRLNQTSAFGAFLDPVADKFPGVCRLLVLVHLDRADVFVALIIIGREIAISSLREWMAIIGATKSVAVHMLGKLKTTVQMVAIPFLLYDGTLFGMVDTALWGHWLIWISAVPTVWSICITCKKRCPKSAPAPAEGVAPEKPANVTTPAQDPRSACISLDYPVRTGESIKLIEFSTQIKGGDIHRLSHEYRYSLD